MRTSLLILALLCAVLAGCSHSGDFGAFIVTEVGKFGGHTKTNAMLPELDARWTIKRDKNGFQASIKGTTFTNIDTVMQQAFGTPKISTEGTDTATGQPWRVWGAGDIGVAIQLMGQTNGADIICVRAMRDMTEMFREMDRPWWRFW